MSGQIPDGGLSLACLGLTVNINSWFCECVCLWWRQGVVYRCGGAHRVGSEQGRMVARLCGDEGRMGGWISREGSRKVAWPCGNAPPVPHHHCCAADMLPMALASAVNTSVSNALGSGDARTAAQAFRVGLALAVVLQLGLALGMATGGQYLVAMLCQGARSGVEKEGAAALWRLAFLACIRAGQRVRATPRFSDRGCSAACALHAAADEAVRALTRSILPVLASIIVVDGLNSVISGTLRGAGRQRLGAIVNGVGCALAVPAAWLLGSSAGLGAAGLWAGVFIGAALQLVVLMSVLLRATGGEGAAGKAAGAAARQEEPARRAAAQRWWTWDWDHEAVRLQGVARTAGAH